MQEKLGVWWWRLLLLLDHHRHVVCVFRITILDFTGRVWGSVHIFLSLNLTTFVSTDYMCMRLNQRAFMGWHIIFRKQFFLSYLTAAFLCMFKHIHLSLSPSHINTFTGPWLSALVHWLSHFPHNQHPVGNSFYWTPQCCLKCHLFLQKLKNIY